MREQKFVVENKYPVYFTRDVFSEKNHCFAESIDNFFEGSYFSNPYGDCGNRKISENYGAEVKKHRILFFIDDGVLRAWPNLTSDIAGYFRTYRNFEMISDQPITLPGGEACKNDQGLLWETLQKFSKLKVDRHSFVVAIGGGAVLDFVGFISAIVHRGIRHIRMPTTVLSQNDSGVGVKNGINAFGQKNFLGTFAPPVAVINDFNFLDSLSLRDKMSGLSEAIKVAMIKDADFFFWLERNAFELKNFQFDAVDYMIKRCADLHMQHIVTSGDPFERGSSRPLDFGHWAAHRLENMTHHEIRHGEAVAIGMLIDLHCSVQKGFIPFSLLLRVYDLLHKLGLPTWHNALKFRDEFNQLSLIKGLEEFREHLGGRLSITLIEDIGRCKEVSKISSDQIEYALKWLEGMHLNMQTSFTVPVKKEGYADHTQAR
ncbi:MAG: 3-dehydroquinate synthase [Bdellovibrionota bacterium]